jgi:alpha-beta hydrolase superfamily lysophospholipase
MTHDYSAQAKESQKSFGSNWKIDTLQTFDGTTIRYGTFAKDLSQVKRYIVFLNGHSEFIEKYDYLPQELDLPLDCGFLTWDHRSQGLSSGATRLHFDDYRQPAEDTKFIIDKVIGKTPYVFIGHSMGGLITLYSLMNEYIKPEKILLSSPLLGITHPVPDRILKAVSRFSVWLGCGRWYIQKNIQKNPSYESNVFTMSRERFSKRYTYPFYLEGVTFGWGHATSTAFDFVFTPEHLAKISCPVKILMGEDERIVSNDETIRWLDAAKKYSKSEVSYQIVPGTRHELFAEAKPAYDQVLKIAKQYLAV